MIENVFRPSRRVDGKRKVSRTYSGRYRVDGDGKIITVALNTPDRRIAEKRLRDIIVERQAEREGLIAPQAVRSAAGAALLALIGDYEADLKARQLDAVHIKDTTQRLRRMAREANWTRLGDIAPESFIRWRGTLTCSAKTRKEYQVSANAFLNWLVKAGRLGANPLAKVPMIDPRGKSVRESRAFTVDELGRLFAVSERRAIAYRALLYLGQRKEAIRALTWGDVHLDGERALVTIRASSAKNKRQHSVPVHPELARVLRAIRPTDAGATDKVFFGWFPTYETLRRDLEAAGIPHKDELGRVVHFHAFRKTFQTLGARSGLGQRAAQEILGHSTPALTANVYTDVLGLGHHEEIAKLPWLDPKPISDAQLYAQKMVPAGQNVSRAVTEGREVEPAEIVDFPDNGHADSRLVTLGQSRKMVVGTGFEPV